MFPDNERFRWFEDHTRKIVAKCWREANAIPGFSESPVPFYVPGGDDKYPSFWIRDFVMQCRSGFVPADTMRTLLRLILSYQNGPRRRDLANGLRVDPWAIADHINLPGVGDAAFHQRYGMGAVFYPGSYSPTHDQGVGRYGVRPADDDIYETVELARLTVAPLEDGDREALLRSMVGDVTIFDRLHKGMQAMTVHPETGLCWNRPGNWAAANFHDGLKPMGLIAVTSCLRFRAARTMVEFSRLVGDRDRSELYASTVDRIAGSVIRHCMMPSGWLMAGTELNRQPDVWSTSMAVYYGILEGEARQAACRAMLQAYRDGAVARFGYLRHTPTFGDAVPGKRVWEDDAYHDSLSYGVYQNGGYWPQPLGYYAFALAQVDCEAAAQIVCEFIDYTRQRTDAGAPFEWLNPDLGSGKEEGKWYGPSATLPLEGFRRLSSGTLKGDR